MSSHWCEKCGGSCRAVDPRTGTVASDCCAAPHRKAVLTAAVAMREATEGKRDRPMREYQEALLNLVDALLATEPGWVK